MSDARVLAHTQTTATPMDFGDSNIGDNDDSNFQQPTSHPRGNHFKKKDTVKPDEFDWRTRNALSFSLGALRTVKPFLNALQSFQLSVDPSQKVMCRVSCPVCVQSLSLRYTDALRTYVTYILIKQ